VTSATRAFFELISHAHGKNFYNEFMLKYGRDYQIGPETFKGPRATPKECYVNALMLALRNPTLTYVEGKVGVFGVPIDHAWCVDENNIVVDPTIDNNDGRVLDYYGVPFRTAYVHAAATRNKLCCVLDFFSARKTAPKLFELGLEAGQQWLLDEVMRKPRKRKRKEDSTNGRARVIQA
jgi:hypothetical protein